MNDNRNMILAIVLSALVLLGWSLLSDRFFPTAGPQTVQVENGKAKPLPQPRRRSRPPTRPQAIRARADRARRNPARAHRTRPASPGSINLKGARIDDLVLRPPARDDRRRIRRRCGCCRRPARPGAYFASFGWTGEGVAAPDADTVWTAERADA